MPEDNPHKALIATDDANLARILRTMLEFANIDVTFKSPSDLNPRGSGTPYILIIVDGDLPGPRPYNTCAIISISPSDHVEAYDLGADLVIDKPLVANVFLAKVRSVMRRYGHTI